MKHGRQWAFLPGDKYVLNKECKPFLLHPSTGVTRSVVLSICSLDTLDTSIGKLHMFSFKGLQFALFMWWELVFRWRLDHTQSSLRLSKFLESLFLQVRHMMRESMHLVAKTSSFETWIRTEEHLCRFRNSGS